MAWCQRYDARFQDIAEPLVTLARMADAECGGSRITDALQRGLPHLVGERKPEGDQLTRALCDLEEAALSNQEAVFIPSQRLLEIVQDAGFWWVESPKALAEMLKKVGLYSRSTGEVHGYDLTVAWFQGLKNTIRQGVPAAPAAEF